MALSGEFKMALDIYKLEREFGTLKDNRENLLHALKRIFYDKCRIAYPQISHHVLWRLRDGSLALIILAGEVKKIFYRYPIFREQEEKAILAEAAMGGLHVAPVSSCLRIRGKTCTPESIENRENVPPQLMRDLRRVYKLQLDDKMYYAYPAREKEISLTLLETCLGRPRVELWKFSTKNRSRPPMDFGLASERQARGLLI